MGVVLLRPVLRRLASQRIFGCSRVLQAALFHGDTYFPSAERFQARWLSTLGVELDRGRIPEASRQTPTVIQRASINQQLEHKFETILCNPRGIATCSEEDLIFVSDSLHDRIIVLDGSGRVLDYIGSIAGFEDGSFESARLRRPSSIVFDKEKKLLYIADCENHAIRRAHISSRMVDTLYPKPDECPGFLQRWLHRLGILQGSSQKRSNVSNDYEMTYPWHLSVVSSGHVIASTQWFKQSWMIDVDTGALTVEPDQEPATTFKKLMKSKIAELEDNNLDWESVYEALVSKGLACEGLSNVVSQVAALAREIVVIDPETHQVSRLDLSSGYLSPMQLSNVAILGLPAWWCSYDNPQVASSLERLHEGRTEEDIVTFAIQPGRHLICVNVALPRGTLLAEPFTEECLWRQSRGSVVDLSTFEGELKSRKVTAAQRYFDDLNFLDGTKEYDLEDPAEVLHILQQSPSRLSLCSTVDVSLGTGEVVFDAVLYLKPDWSVDSEIKPDFPNDCGEFSGHARKVTMRFSQNLEVFSDGAVMMKHLNFRVRCVVSADASATSTMQLDVQL